MAGPMRLLSQGGASLVGIALVLALAAPGCRRGEPADDGAGAGEDTAGSDTAAAPAPRPESWPRVLVVTPGTGPALYLGHESNAPAVGYLAAGTRVRMESAPTNDRVEVLVGGALATKGWVPLSRLGAYAQERGRVEGTRAYLAAGDLVSLAAPEGDTWRIESRPWLGGERFLGPFVGTFAAAQLASDPPEGEVEGLSPGECYRLPAGQTVTVYERPNGEAIASLPATDPPLAVTVLRERGGWYGARIGFGPYLTGYVQGALTACDGEMPAPEPVRPAGGERPFWMSQEQGNLHRVAAGTRVRFHGRTIARLRGEGWARELGRQDGDLVDVFLAADDGAAIRGLVPADSLTLVEGEAASAPAPEEEEEELPDELQ